MAHYSGWLDRQNYSGHEGVTEFMRTWIRSFDNWEPSPERFIEAVGLSEQDARADSS